MFEAMGMGIPIPMSVPEGEATGSVRGIPMYARPATAAAAAGVVAIYALRQSESDYVCTR